MTEADIAALILGIGFVLLMGAWSLVRKDDW